MKFKKGLFAAAAALALLVTLLPVSQAEAAGRFGGRVFVGGGFGGRVYFGPSFYPYPYYYSYWGQPYYSVAPNAGDVKIESHVKGASIYVDGGFAGVTGKTNKFPLQPGIHDIQVKDPAGNTMFQNKVQVLVGKTVEIKL